MADAVKLMLIYLDEHDQGAGDVPLYEAIVRKLELMKVAGATVLAGIMGFGTHRHVHHSRLFGVSDERSIVVMVCETEEKIQEILPVVKGMVPEGLILIMDAQRVL